MTFKLTYLLAFLTMTSSGQVLSFELDMNIYDVDFDLSMEFTKKDRWSKKRLKKEKHHITQFCKELYNRNSLIKLQPEDAPLIPKIVHLIWVGPKTPPPVYNACLESVKKYLPDWECKIWTDKDIPHLDLVNKRFYDQETNYGAKADILRYELLYQFGGVYLDVDFVLRKPLDILNHTYEFYGSMMPSYNLDVVSNGIIGSIPGHPILKHCIDSLKKYRKKKWIVKRTGPIAFQKSFYKVAKEMPDRKIVAFPKSFFIPLDKNQIKLSPKKEARYIKPETFAIHYWAYSWNEKK